MPRAFILIIVHYHPSTTRSRVKSDSAYGRKYTYARDILNVFLFRNTADHDEIGNNKGMPCPAE
jgi:hypothetical protein